MHSCQLTLQLKLRRSFVWFSISRITFFSRDLFLFLFSLCTFREVQNEERAFFFPDFLVINKVEADLQRLQAENVQVS